MLILSSLQVAVLDPATGAPLSAAAGPATGLLVVTRPWPGLGRTIQGDHQRYLSTYMGYRGFYFTGDGATIEPSGYVWINGRVDDVLNVSGHRLGTAELENALVNHPACPEAACIAVAHELKARRGSRAATAFSHASSPQGQCVYAFVVLREGYVATPELRHALSAQVVKVGGCSLVSCFPNFVCRRWGPLRGPRRWCCARRCPRRARAKSCAGCCAKSPSGSLRTWVT